MIDPQPYPGPRLAGHDVGGESTTVPGDSEPGRTTEVGVTRLLVVEDEESIVAPFVSALERNGFGTIVARTAAEALLIAEQDAPQLVLLDLFLPDGDGRDVCRELRRRFDVPIIMLTARGTEADRIVGLELGADDYIVKPFAVDEVIARIRAVLRRYRRAPLACLETVTVGDLRLDLGARRTWLAGREVRLTRKEFDLLVRLARDVGNVVTREALMSDVWDEN
jgi:DNA-binding response OmpR family regulator